jgi:hypothetical protein
LRQTIRLPLVEVSAPDPRTKIFGRRSDRPWSKCLPQTFSRVLKNL